MKNDQLQAAIVFNAPLNDGCWNEDCYEGMKILESDYGYQISYTEDVKSVDFAKAFRTYAEAGYDLIIAPGGEFEDAVKEICEEFPNTHFAGINFLSASKNVSSLHHNNIQSGFLFGSLAALMTGNNSVGYIYSLDIPSMCETLKAAGQAVEYVNPGCALAVAATGSFSDVSKGKEAALSQIENENVDVIIPVAAACGAGILEACEEKGCNLVYGPNDGLKYSDKILGSIIMSNSGMIAKIGEMFKNGLDEGICFEGNCANRIIRYGSISSAVPKEVIDKLHAIESGLADGSIVIK